MSFFHSFRPTEGAVLDQDSLQAIADIPTRMLSAYMDSLAPGTPNIILSGLEIAGGWAAGGPPGTKCPDPQSPCVVVEPGSAIVRTSKGECLLLEIKERQYIPWPTNNGPKVYAGLVLTPQIEGVQLAGGINVARDKVSAKIGFVDIPLVSKPSYLPIAVAVGNQKEWATDFRRIYHPSHDVIGILIKRFEDLERSVWNAEPEGNAWGNETLGKNWFRYQTVGAAALQATRAMLMTYPTTTMDRVCLLKTLREQLEASVESVATELLQIIGSRDGAGPYAEVLPKGD
ncbi:MAG: hypothetical protein VX278_09645 [Myxococcota bacterium]|nr:hypothetical protein [Myxococcota bacterium]